MWLSTVLVSAALALGAAPGAVQSACRNVTVQAAVVVSGEELTLTDLLAQDSCSQLRAAAGRVGLGAAPRAGALRVFDGDEILRRIQNLAFVGIGDELAVKVPERIVVQRGAALKSCAEIANFVGPAASAHEIAGTAGTGERNKAEALDCAAARSIPEEAELELTKSSWNASLQRWEFALRCIQAEECVPFLVWFDEPSRVAAGIANARAGFGGAPVWLASSGRGAQRLPGGGEIARLVKPGQTATLSWDARGIRIVLPVTCLDGGAAGEMVRVRFNNTSRILRAEVLGDGTLRASLQR